MKRFFLFLSLVLLSVLRAADSPAVTGAAPRAEAVRDYQCSMHPWIHSDVPGKCTICGMDLVAVAPATESGPRGVVRLGASAITAIGVQTAVVTRQPLTRTVRVGGRIEDDDTRHRILSARVPGRVEKLFLTFVGEPVEAGAALATIWSPEVLSAERVFVERIKSGNLAYSASERAASREQLQLLGLAEADIAHLEQTLEPSAIVTIRSPMAGTVVAKSVYEGQYVQASDRLFEIGDFSQMWFVFDAFAQDVPWLHVGQTVEVTTRAVPGEVIRAPIAFIDPNFDEQRQTTRVRAVLPNPHYSVGGEPHQLPHRVLAEGRVLVETPAVLAAPRSAVLDAGSGPVAYVDLGGNGYQQRALQLGRRGDGLVEILAGLAEGEQVVTEGNLLIDAQAQLTREATVHDPVATTAAASASGDFAALAAAAIEGADALASDDFARYQKFFPRIAVAAQGFDLPPLAPADSLLTARRTFEPWSTQAAGLLLSQRARLGLKIFQCPMSPVLDGKGRWLQRALPLKNPFFGSGMPDCGTEVP